MHSLIIFFFSLKGWLCFSRGLHTIDKIQNAHLHTHMYANKGLVLKQNPWTKRCFWTWLWETLIWNLYILAWDQWLKLIWGNKIDAYTKRNTNTYIDTHLVHQWKISSAVYAYFTYASQYIKPWYWSLWLANFVIYCWIFLFLT